MKFYQYNIIIAALLLVTTVSNAQQVIDPTLEVNRNFDAKLLEISKSKLYTSFNDSLGRFDLSFDYTIFDKPMKDLYEFSPLSSAKIEKNLDVASPFLFLKAGTNMPLNPYGSIYLQPRIANNLSLVITGSHNSFLSKLPAYSLENQRVNKGATKIAAPSSNTNLGLDFKYHWNKGEVGLNGGYKNRMSSYYGFNQEMISSMAYYPLFEHSHSQSFMRDSMSHSTNITGATLYVKSLNKNPNSFYYNVTASYSKLFDRESHIYSSLFVSPSIDNIKLANNKLSEQYLNLALTTGAGFAGFNKILAGVKYETSNSQYSDSLNRSNLELHPRYLFKKGKWSFDLGFKYNMWWDVTSHNFNIYLSSSAQIEIIDNKFWLYGLIDGKNNFMNYQKILEMNPWISSATPVQNIEQPIIARVGIKGKIKDKLSYNLYGSYDKYIDQIYFFSNTLNYFSENLPINSFDALYKNEKRIGIGAEVSFYSKSFEGSFNTNIYNYKDDNNMTNTHYNYSPFELKVTGRYNWRERIVISGAFMYKQKSPALIDQILISSTINPTIYMPSYARLDLNLSYVYNKNLTFFIQLNNILNSKVFEYTNYTMPGFNGGAGLTFKL